MSKESRYEACMVLSAAGDSLGYHNKRWEFMKDGAQIHKEVEQLGGINNIKLEGQSFRVSDDTVMHIATAEALITKKVGEELFLMLARKYKECMSDMFARSVGLTCRNNAYALQPDSPKGYQIPFDERGGGCGAAMRTMCIGLLYSRVEDEDKLISVSIEAGRMTHHHPAGYLGGLVSALFTSYAIQDIPVKEWGSKLMKEILPKALLYIESQNRYVQENKNTWNDFLTKWENYLKERKIEDGLTEPSFPKHYGVKERDAFYNSISFDGWGGASGYDSTIIAYDAMLACYGSWTVLCERATLHGGDNDSTGAIASAWYGAMYGYGDSPTDNFKNLEYRERIENLSKEIIQMSFIE